MNRQLSQDLQFFKTHFLRIILFKFAHFVQNKIDYLDRIFS